MWSYQPEKEKKVRFVPYLAFALKWVRAIWANS
jgi:hypothetical protein